MKRYLFFTFLFLFLTVTSLAVADKAKDEKEATTVPVQTTGSQGANSAASNPAIRMPSDSFVSDPFQDWDPFQEMSKLQARMQRLFNQNIFGTPQSLVNQGLVNASSAGAAMDVAETPNEVIVTVDVPGISKEDLKVEVQNGILHVSGDRKVTSDGNREGQGFQYRVQERSRGSFSRSMKLPDNVDVEHIRAEHKDGILTLHLPKTAKEEPKKIKVNIQ